MRRNIILMAKSKKGDDGYCVAGIDTSSGEWVRLNVRGYYSIPRTLFKYPDGAEPELLDTISVDILSKDHSEPFQPENYLCSMDFQRTAADDVEVALERIEKDKLLDDIFYDNDKAIECKWLETCGEDYYSLIVVEPQGLRLYKNGKKVTAYFNYKGKRYSGLHVTDLELIDSWDELGGKQSLWLGDDYILVISLGLPYTKENGPEKCWKLIASAVHKSWLEQEDDVDEEVPEEKEHTDIQDTVQDLYEELKKLRKTIADREGLPAYCIFQNRTLEDMVMKMPKDSEELLAVYGIGKSRAEKYGAEFLEIIRSYDNENDCDEEIDDAEDNDIDSGNGQISLVELINDIKDGIDPITGETFNESNLLEDKAFINAITQLYKKYAVERTDKPSRAGEAWSKGKDAQLKEDDSSEISEEEMSLLSELRNSKAKEHREEKRSCDNCKLYLNENCGGLKGMCEDYEYAPVITEEEKKVWPTEMKGPYGKGYGRNRRR